MGFHSPTDSPFAQLSRRLCETETTKKEPITSNMMKALVTKYGGENSSILDFTFLLTCLLVFAGLLCVEELLDVKLKHIKIQESHLEMLI